MNTQNNDSFNQLQQELQTINSVLEGIVHDLPLIQQGINEIKTQQLTIETLQQELEGVNNTLEGIVHDLPSIQQGINEIKTQQLTIETLQQELEGINNTLAQVEKDTGKIAAIQLVINDVQQKLGEISLVLHTIDNADKSLYDLYDIYRDHMKHEDTLGNQRINILLASQSFLFFPYFSILKDYRNHGYSSYDSLLLFGICFLGVGINFIVRPSIRGFIDASSHIENVWKNEILASKKLFQGRYNTKFRFSKKLPRPTSIEYPKANHNDDISFIIIDTKTNDLIPNIRYENPFWHLRFQMKILTNQIPILLSCIWVVLFIIPYRVFPSRMPSESKSSEEVKLEKMLNKIYETELNQKIEEEKQKTENDLQEKLENCKAEIIEANPPMTKDRIGEKLDSCFNENNDATNQ